MILQALTEYYETLSLQNNLNQDIPRFGWSKTTATFCILLDSTGTVKEFIPLINENKKGRPVTVPVQLKRSGINPPPYFLCDSATYMLGLENGVATPRALKYFQAFSELHQKLLKNVDCIEAAAVTEFLKHWNPSEAENNPAVQAAFSDGMGRGNLVFRVFDNSTWVLDAKEIVDAWNLYYAKTLNTNGQSGVCMVTGERATIARIHNSVKGIYASSLAPNGWTLVGVDKGSPAFSSYGKEQGYNSPTSEYAAFAYTTALNHLLADREHVYQMGDATVVCWARSGGDVYQNIFGAAFFGQGPAYTLTDLQGTLNNLCNGFAVDLDEERLDPNMDFYILGLSPNAARLSVRFFFRNTFGAFLRNAQAHQQRLEIVKPAYDMFDTIPMWKLLYETVNQNSRDKTPAPNMAGEVLRAVLTDTRYPATLLNGVALRIRAEHSMTRGRAAILKAYYLKNTHPDVPKEVLTVSLNPDSTNIPYNLGRLFSLLEAVQSAANPGINTTIKDKYFNSASATPAIVFPVLVNLAQKHLKKLDGGLRTHYDKQITTLLSKLGESYPPRMNLPQQGCFQLGYYHQTQSRFEKKEEK